MASRLIGPLQVSLLGLGCNNFGMRIDETAATAVVHAALDAGVTYFDTADGYGKGASEEMLGRALGTRRDEAVVATKFGSPSAVPDGVRGGSAEWVRAAADASLARLGMDVIDHYQLHYPDPQTPIAETLHALQELIDAGKVRAIGCSNFTAAQLDEAAAVAAAEGVTPFASVQNKYSVLTRTPEVDGVLDACTRHSVTFVPYFPLESGLLTGKYLRRDQLPEGSRLDAWKSIPYGEQFLTEEMFTRMEQLSEYADSKSHSLLELAIGWLAAQPAVASIITGATSPAQVTANVGAAGWSLDADALAAIDALVPAS